MAQKALPGSGEIKLTQIASELNDSSTDISLESSGINAGLISAVGNEISMFDFYGYTSTIYIEYSSTFVCNINSDSEVEIEYSIDHSGQQSDQTLKVNFSYAGTLGGGEIDRTVFSVDFSDDNGSNWSTIISELYNSDTDNPSTTINGTGYGTIDMSNYANITKVKLNIVNNRAGEPVTASVSLVISSIEVTSGSGSAEPGDRDTVYIDQDTCGGVSSYTLSAYNGSTDTSITTESATTLVYDKKSKSSTGAEYNVYCNTNVFGSTSTATIYYAEFNDNDPLGSSATSTVYFKTADGSWRSVGVQTDNWTSMTDDPNYNIITYYSSNSHITTYWVQHKSTSPSTDGETILTRIAAEASDTAKQVKIIINVTDDKRANFEYTLSGLRYDDSIEPYVTSVNTNTSYTRYLNINYIDVDNGGEAALCRFSNSDGRGWLGTTPTSYVYFKVDDSAWKTLTISTTGYTHDTGLRYDLYTIYHSGWTPPQTEYKILANSESDDVNSSVIYLSELPNLNMKYATVTLNKSDKYKPVVVRFYSTNGSYAWTKCELCDLSNKELEVSVKIVFDYFAINQNATLSFKFGYKNAIDEDIRLEYTKYYDGNLTGWSTLCSDREVEDDGWVSCTGSLSISGEDWNDSDNPMDIRLNLSIDGNGDDLPTTLYVEIDTATIDNGTISIGNINSATVCTHSCQNDSDCTNQPECASF